MRRGPAAAAALGGAEHGEVCRVSPGRPPRPQEKVPCCSAGVLQPTREKHTGSGASLMGSALGLGRLGSAARAVL